MLSAALEYASRERGISLREIGRRLGYKQPVVLSHMATGRIPIPLDRTADIAHALDMPLGPFVLAVLNQRHPGIPWGELMGPSEAGSAAAAQFVWAIEAAAGQPLSKLTPEQHRVMREVAASPNPARRWLTPHETGVMEMLRRSKPSLPQEGFTQPEVEKLARCLELPTDKLEDIEGYGTF